METKQEFISKVFDLIKNPEAFTSNWFARDQDGKSVSWDDPNAVRFDLLGAVEKIGANEPKLKEEVLRDLREKIPQEFGPLYKFSERGCHEQVLAFLNRLLNPDGKTSVEKSNDQTENDVEKPGSKNAEPGSKVETNVVPSPVKRRGRQKGSKNKAKTE